MVSTLTANSRGQALSAVRAVYERWTQRSASLSVPILVLVAALAPLILGAWLGHVPPTSAFVLAALSVGYVVYNTTGVGYAVAYAYGFPGIPAKAAVYMAVANVVLTVAAAPLFGVWGVLSGTALAFTGGAICQVWLLHRRFDMPMAVYWRAVLPTFGLATLLAIPLVILSIAMSGQPRWAEAAAVCLGGAYFVAAYLYGAARLNTLPEALARRLVSTGVRSGTASL